MTRLSTMFFALTCAVSAVFADSTHVNGARHEAHNRIMRVRATNNGTSRVEDVPGLAKRFSGARFTEFETGLGACGSTNSDSDFIVALNAAQYDSSDSCFKTITITCGGKTAQAQIVDRCIGCPYAGLDLTPSLFAYFGDINQGTLYGDWVFGNAGPSTTSTSTHTTSTSIWTPPPSTTHHSTTSSSIWSSSTTWAPSSTSTTVSSTSWSSSSSISSTTSSSTPTATPSVTPDNSFIDAMDYLVMQFGDLFAVAAQANLQIADSV